MNTQNISRNIAALLLAFMPAAVSAQQYGYGTQVPDTAFQRAVRMGVQEVMGAQSRASESYEERIRRGNVNPTLAKPDNSQYGNSLYERNLKRRHIERVSRDDLKATFIPKGMWMAGGTVNYQEWDNEDTDFLVLKNLNLEGRTFSLSPAVGYFVANNIAIGARYNYSRNYFFLGDLDLNLGEDLNISLKDLYYLQHKHEGSFFVRTYMPLFGSKTLGFFSEVRATYTNASGKNSTGNPEDHTFDGVYERSHSVGLGFTPGLCVFATNFAAVECSVGMLGLHYRWTDQTHYEDNADLPVYTKRSQSGGANFKFNLFSINIGMTFYL